MNQEFNRPDDFLLDDSFLQYCTRANQHDIQYWENWLTANPDKRPLFEKAKQLFVIINGQQGELDAAVSEFRSLLAAHALQPGAKTKHLYRWLTVAATLLLLVGASWYLADSKWRTAGKQQPVGALADILPGSSKAKLIRGDGSAVQLDSLHSGALKEPDGTRINKGEGKLVYDATGQTGNAVVFNTLATPRGGEYQLVLPDGSKVWLNAASSLRFPTKFAGRERTVYLAGEAYFEVAQHATQPFSVQLESGVKIAVLGTTFNIMDYHDENTVNTTLVTGKVKISANGNSVLLAPAEQAVWKKTNSELLVLPADVDKVLAWKSGLFEFDDDDISTVMRQLARWYDVDVTFAGPIPDQHYTGSIRKQSTLSQALRILKTAGIQYRIEGKQIIVEVKH